MRTKNRIWEVDFVRGLAIILMVAFHLVYNLREFYGYRVDYLNGVWYYVGKLAAVLFILTAGISSTLSRSNLRRGALVFGYGLLLTVVTFIFTPGSYIRFGILHFLGFGMVLYHYLSRVKTYQLLVLGASVIVLGNVFMHRVVLTPYLFPLGLVNQYFVSVDYYPLLPWFGVFLFGVAIGRFLYSDQRSRLGNPPKLDPLSYLGRRSLIIYLVHQPILLALLYLGHWLMR